jgi:diadenosine tetraphosphatase ApaH/serine/threonine PP2A family protein phosphatase
MYAILDHGRLIVAHGGWYEGLEHAKSGKRRSWCLYGPTTGKTLENGLPERIDWATQRKVFSASPTIVYGHQPHEEVRDLNRTMCIDTGCCFGGKLTALRWPEKEIVQVQASAVWDREGRKLNGFGSSEG